MNPKYNTIAYTNLISTIAMRTYRCTDLTDFWKSHLCGGFWAFFKYKTHGRLVISPSSHRLTHMPWPSHATSFASCCCSAAAAALGAAPRPLVQLLQPCRRCAPALVSGLFSCMLIFSSHRRRPKLHSFALYLISAALRSICLSVLHASTPSVAR